MANHKVVPQLESLHGIIEITRITWGKKITANCPIKPWRAGMQKNRIRWNRNEEKNEEKVPRTL